MKNLNRKNYNTLSQAQKEELLINISTQNPQFSFVRFEHFNRFGMELFTAIYSFEKKDFVFVPGDDVTLGWESFSEGMDDKTRLEMEEAFSEYYDDFDLIEHLKENSSPVRSATIAPMLVERELNEIGWETVELDSEDMEPYKEDIEKFKTQTYQRSTIDKDLRLTKSENGIIADLYYPLSYMELISSVESIKGFSLPTEDEWEYLCGGGKRTLFRWGDSFDYDMKLKFFSDNQPSDAPFTLQLPNQFGLSIAYDPYKYEVIKSSNDLFLKGGDGGSNLCGGMGKVLGYLPTATYYRGGYDGAEDELEYKEDIGGDYTTYRRIFRLNQV